MVQKCAIAHVRSQQENHKIILNLHKWHSETGFLTLNDDLTKEFRHDDSL